MHTRGGGAGDSLPWLGRPWWRRRSRQISSGGFLVENGPPFGVKQTLRAPLGREPAAGGRLARVHVDRGVGYGWQKASFVGRTPRQRLEATDASLLLTRTKGKQNWAVGERFAREIEFSATRRNCKTGSRLTLTRRSVRRRRGSLSSNVVAAAASLRRDLFARVAAGGGGQCA